MVWKDRQLSHIEIESSSGQASFDDLVLAIIKSMNGKEVLKFPPGADEKEVRFSMTLSSDEPKLILCPVDPR